jgi:hypothetical protein
MQGLFFVGEIIVETCPRPLRKAKSKQWRVCCGRHLSMCVFVHGGNP